MSPQLVSSEIGHSGDLFHKKAAVHDFGKTCLIFKIIFAPPEAGRKF